MKIGIYGGTFDPPHLGHRNAAQAAVTLLGLDRLIVVPAGLPPHKALSENSAGAGERLEMARLNFDGISKDVPVAVSDLEVRREGKSYTSDTLLELRKEYPDDEFCLLMGTDMFLTLQNWHDPGVICAQATLVPFARTEADNGELFEIQGKYLAERFGAKVAAIQLPAITDASSTRLREELAAGQGSESLWCQVYGYILREKLYGTDADLRHLPPDLLRPVSYSMVRAKRIPHIRGTEEEAVKLAVRWGADADRTRRAAILHDCTKYLDLDEQLKLCEHYGILLDTLERRAVKLLHAKTGAAIARDVFGEPEDECSAIYWHTTGRADMTLMEKILYMADYIEPNRKFDEVDEMRALAYSDLDGALILGLELSIQEMNEKNRTVHHSTVEAYDFLRENHN